MKSLAKMLQSSSLDFIAASNLIETITSDLKTEEMNSESDLRKRIWQDAERVIKEISKI